MLGEGENGRGRVSTPPTSDLLLSEIQSVFYLQRRGRKRLEAEKTRKKRLGCEACSGSFYAHSIKLQCAWEKKWERDCNKKWENLDKGRKYGAYRRIQMQTSGALWRKRQREGDTEETCNATIEQPNHRFVPTFSPAVPVLFLCLAISRLMSLCLSQRGERLWHHSEFWDAAVSGGRSWSLTLAALFGHFCLDMCACLLFSFVVPCHCTLSA